MTQQSKTWAWGAGIISLILIGGTLYFAQADNEPENVIEKDDEGEVLSADAVFINAKHQFRDGEHIIAGEIEVPTQCHSLSVETVIRESFPEQVTLNFSSTSEAEVCAQVMSPRRFKIDFSASENATINATWNGAEAVLNLIPAGEDEDLNNFDIFIKG